MASFWLLSMAFGMQIHFKDAKLGLQLSDGPPVCVTGLVPKSAASRNMSLAQQVSEHSNPRVVAINEDRVGDRNKAAVSLMLRKAGRPVKITFEAPVNRVNVRESTIEDYCDIIKHTS